MTLIVSFQVSFGQHWGTGLILTLNAASESLLFLVIMIAHIFHLVVDAGLLRAIVKVLLCLGVWVSWGFTK